MVKPTKHSIDEGLVRTLADLLNETGLSEIEYGLGDMNIRVAKTLGTGTGAPLPAPHAAVQPATPTAASTPTGNAATDELVNHPGCLTSPMVGTVYTSSDPAAPVYVKVGDKVSEGQTVLLIEAMKVFNPIVAPKAGTVTHIFISSGAPVEFGEPLLVIE